MPDPTGTGDVLLVERADGVATLTLNRPAARNALSSELLSELRGRLADADADDSIAVVILTGTDPAFCAGLDLKELSAGGALLNSERDAALPEGVPWVPLGKPVIGAINGVAITGGLELALNCDFLVASQRAAFADTHARVGLLPGWGLSVLLPQRVGFGMARRMSFTGDFVAADDALAAGLVTQVVPHDELLPAARRLASTIAANNGPAIAALLQSYRRIEAQAAGEGIRLEAEAFRAWRRGGGAENIAGRVEGVLDRGRSQLSGRTQQPAS
jgi:enoyl-CoA hydratase